MYVVILVLNIKNKKIHRNSSIYKTLVAICECVRILRNQQGSKGIRQWLINSCTSLMMIQKIITFGDYN